MKQTKQIIKRPFLFLLLYSGRFFKEIFDKPFHKNSIQNILIVQTGGIGDVLMIFPIVEVLSQKFPHAQITTLTEHGSDLFKLMNNVNLNCRHLFFDFSKGYLNKLSQIRSLRKHSFDLIIIPARGDGMIECSIIAFLIGADYRIGFIKDGAGFLHTNKTEFREDASILEQNMELLKHLGICTDIKNISLKIPDEDRSFAEKLLKKYTTHGEMLVVIHPWAGSYPETKTWPLGNYVKLSGHILDHYNARIILLGSHSEKLLSQQFSTQLGHPGLMNLTGATTLSQTAAIIKKSNLFIGNDSSLLHIANALRIPSICIFGSTSPQQILSPDHNCIPVTINLPCQPCYLHQPLFRHRCPYDYKCLKDLSVEDMIKKADSILLDVKK
jgi:lipopolysaccharide heptosyltransferase II